MKISNEQAWQEIRHTGKSPYGRAIKAYAVRWAKMMEAALNKGEQLEDVWLALSYKANKEKITYQMYDLALTILGSCWLHGEQLIRLHNLYWSPTPVDGTPVVKKPSPDAKIALGKILFQAPGSRELTQAHVIGEYAESEGKSSAQVRTEMVQKMFGENSIAHDYEREQ